MSVVIVFAVVFICSFDCGLDGFCFIAFITNFIEGLGLRLEV